MQKLKKTTALLSALLFTSTLMTACANNASPYNPDNNRGTANTTDVKRGADVSSTTNRMTTNRTVTMGDTPRPDSTLESRVEALPGISNATVLVAGKFAFVLVDQISRGGHTTAGTGAGVILSTDMRTRISSTIQSANPAIRNVYFIVR